MVPPSEKLCSAQWSCARVGVAQSQARWDAELASPVSLGAGCRQMLREPRGTLVAGWALAPSTVTGHFLPMLWAPSPLLAACALAAPFAHCLWTDSFPSNVLVSPLPDVM